jgi:hypothetical protein
MRHKKPWHKLARRCAPQGVGSVPPSPPLKVSVVVAFYARARRYQLRLKIAELTPELRPLIGGGAAKKSLQVACGARGVFLTDRHTPSRTQHISCAVRVAHFSQIFRTVKGMEGAVKHAPPLCSWICGIRCS